MTTTPTDRTLAARNELEFLATKYSDRARYCLRWDDPTLETYARSRFQVENIRQLRLIAEVSEEQR